METAQINKAERLKMIIDEDMRALTDPQLKYFVANQNQLQGRILRTIDTDLKASGTQESYTGIYLSVMEVFKHYDQHCKTELTNRGVTFDQDTINPLAKKMSPMDYIREMLR